MVIPLRKTKPTVLAGVALASTVLLAACATEEAVGEDTLIPIPSNLNEYQRAILDDNIVTDGEYLQAVQDEMACVQQKGYVATDLRKNELDGRSWIYGIEYRAGESEADARARQAARDSCNREHSDFITQYYWAQLEPEGAEREAAFQELIECLESFGLTEVTSSFSETQVVDAIVVFVGGHDGDSELRNEIFVDCFYPNQYIFAGEAG